MSIGYTESREFYRNYRILVTGLDHILDYVYYPRDHEPPGGTERTGLRHCAPSHYELVRTVVRHTPSGAHKPAPDVLLSIVDDVGARRSQVVYVGDSVRRLESRFHEILSLFEFGAASSRAVSVNKS